MSAWRKIPAAFWQLLMITLLGLPLLTPLWRWTAVACTHDGHLHYHRVAAMRHAWENGLYFTRWLPDLAFGYGYPFFVYREPAPLYAVLLPHLVGLPLPAAENLFYGLCILAGGWFMFLWVRDVFAARAGIVSAVAYMSAPYVLVDALVRGNAPESLALPLLPFLLWSGRRWLLTGGAVWFLTAVLGLAFLSLSHNISLLIFTPTLLFYLWAVSILHKVERRPAVARLALLFGLGLGMTFFYTGGALLEMDAVTLQQSTTTRNNDFHYNFASFNEILAPPAPEDPTLINPPLPFRLGWVFTGLAIWGAFSWFWRPGADTTPGAHHQRLLREQRGHILLMVLATAVFLFMAFPLSVRIWEHVPLIDFAQFPWRFVGRAALPMALLAGAPFAGASSPPVSSPAANRTKGTRKTDGRLRLLFFLVIPLLMIEAIPTLYPMECREEPFPTILTVHRYEHETGLVGVDPEGSYFPRTVQKRPQASPLEADYQAGRPPQRFDITSFPEGAEVGLTVPSPLAATLHLTSPEPFTATYLAFAFPGWQATIDGISVPITPSDPAGLITFPVPAGRHTLEVRWGSTPLRTGLTAVSLLALAVALALAIVRPKQYSVFTGHYSVGMSGGLPTMDYRLLIALSLLMLALKLVVDRTDTPLRRPAEPPVSAAVSLQGGELRLNGFNLSQMQVESGGTFDIDLAWTAVDVPRASYQSNVWLAGPSGLLWSDKETFRPRLYEDTPPTIFWQPGQWAWDSREVQVLSGTPSGFYDIVLTLFDRETLQPVTLVEGAGNVVGPTAVIGQIEVVRHPEPPVFAPQYPVTIAVPGVGATLLGYQQDRAEAGPGDPFLLTLFWQQTAVSSQRLVPVALVNETHTPVHEWQVAISDMAPGDRSRSQHMLRLPATLASGGYRLVVAGETLPGTLTLHAPERLFVAPAAATAVNIPFKLDNTPLVSLVGYTVAELHAPLVFVWRAESTFLSSYRVFVHLVDEAGQIIAQSDGEPASWTRPTTGWVPGEYILDTHTLRLPEDMPAGELVLRVGLYDPATGQRLQTAAADYVEIPWR